MSMQPPEGSGVEATTLVADIDRERAVEALREHCADGRLTFAELADRAGAAYVARTAAELAAVLAGLPVAAPLPVTIAGAGDARPARSVRWSVALMGGVTRRGRWRVHPHSVVVSVMGGCLLDLRSAAIEGPLVELDVVALMGGVEIVVPEGVDVDLVGIAVMGGKDCQLAPVAVRPGTPVVRVRALALMGGVVVHSRPPEGARSAAPGWAPQSVPASTAGGSGP